jgi:hypothetical protein
MPSRNCRKAPKFDRDNAEELLRYLEDVEQCLEAAGITDVAEMKNWARKYADLRTANDWTTLKSYRTGTWDEYKAELISNYPEAANSTSGTFARLDKLCKEYRNLEPQEAGQILAFTRGFAYEGNKLLEKHCASSRELVRKVMDCLSPDLARSLEDRIIIEKGRKRQDAAATTDERHPDDPVPLDEVLELLRNIAKDYTSIGSMFAYGSRTLNSSRHSALPPDTRGFVKIEQYEALQQEVAALKDTADLLKRDNKQLMHKASQQTSSQSVPPRFDNRQTQQVRIQPRPSNSCFYCGVPGHMVRDCEVVKDHYAKGMVKLDAAGGLQWNLIPREPANLLPKERVEQQGKVQNLYTGVDEDFDRAMWEMQIAPPETTNLMTSQGNDDARVWMERCKQVEQQNAQWQKIVQQQQMQSRTTEPTVHQLLSNAVPLASNAQTPLASIHPSLQDQVDILKAEIATLRVGVQNKSGF